MECHNAADFKASKPLTIAFMAVGTRGDIQPLIVLAQHLSRQAKQKGNGRIEVVMIVPCDFVAWIKNSTNTEEWKVIGVPIAFGDLLLETSKHVLHGDSYEVIDQTLHRPDYLHAWLDHALLGCKGADLLVHIGISMVTGWVMADLLKLPQLEVALQPWPRTPTLEPFMPVANSGPFNSVEDCLAGQDAMLRAIWGSAELTANAWRAQHGLQRPLTWADFQEMRGQMPMVCAYSQELLPRPDNWADSVKMAGHIFPHDDDLPPLSCEIEAFLNAGPPPVYLGFGSMPVAASGGLVPLTREVLRLAPHDMRFIIFVGSMDPHEVKLAEYDLDHLHSHLDLSGLSATQADNEAARLDSELRDAIAGDNPSSRALFIKSSPHLKLFPRCAAIALHCGSNTTGAGLASGRPLVPCPMAFDQPFWARQLVKLGVASTPVPFLEITGAAVVAAINEALQPAIVARAHEIGKRVRAEQGVEIAAELMMRMAAQSRGARERPNECCYGSHDGDTMLSNAA